MTTQAIPRPAVLPSEVLSSREKWTQGRFARDAGGESVAYWGPDAVCWCVAGAVERACVPSMPFYRMLARQIGLHDVADISFWNDQPGRRFEQVRAALLAVERELGWHGDAV